MAIQSRTPQDIILTPVITEKAVGELNSENGRKYTFRVRTDSNKIEIKQAVEALFPGVKVDKVNTISIKGKKRVRGRTIGYTSAYKKAVVKVKSDSKSIEFFEGYAQ